MTRFYGDVDVGVVVVFVVGLSYIGLKLIHIAEPRPMLQRHGNKWIK